MRIICYCCLLYYVEQLIELFDDIITESLTLVAIDSRLYSIGVKQISIMAFANVFAC